MNIRLATLSDAEAIASLAGQLGYPTTPAQARQRLERLLQWTDHAIFVAEAPSGGVIGWVHIFGTYLLEEQPYAEIGGLIVDQDQRSSGVGRELLERAEAWAREGGFVMLRVRSNIVRQRAHAFYERNAYQRVKTQHTFLKSLAKDC
jgi:GNAT superfamily N-acetyltransferase